LGFSSEVLERGEAVIGELTDERVLIIFFGMNVTGKIPFYEKGLAGQHWSHQWHQAINCSIRILLATGKWKMSFLGPHCKPRSGSAFGARCGANGAYQKKRPTVVGRMGIHCAQFYCYYAIFIFINRWVRAVLATSADC
jgi:hypothetical protein